MTLLEEYSYADLRMLSVPEFYDVDFFAVNATVTDAFCLMLENIVGQTIGLCGRQERVFHERKDYPRMMFDAFCLSEDPVIIETLRTPNLKKKLCRSFRNKGHVVLPSEIQTNYLIAGRKKSVPTSVFVYALLEANVQFVRITNFGMKEKSSVFFDFSECLAIKRSLATQHGYPPNVWDISFTVRLPYVLVMKIENRMFLPRDVKLDVYNLFTPLNQSDSETHGGSITVLYKNLHAGACKKVKFYSCLYHLVKAANKYKFESLPRTTRWAHTVVNHYDELLQKYKENPDEVGGVRFESRIETRTLAQAVTECNEMKPYDFQTYLGQVNIVVHGLTVTDYLRVRVIVRILHKADLYQLLVSTTDLEFGVLFRRLE